MAVQKSRVERQRERLANPETAKNRESLWRGVTSMVAPEATDPGYLEETGQAPRPAPTPVPTRDTARETAQQLLDEKRQREKEKAAREAGARGTAAEYRAGSDPPGQGARSGLTPPPSDTPLPKTGTGPGASSTAPAPKAGGDYYGDVKAVKMPDGKMAFVDPEAAERVRKAGGEYTDYTSAVQRAGTRVGETGPEQGGNANVVSGPAGTAMFSGSGEGVADAIPEAGDRSPGWATRAAYNERFREGDLSMDPRDVMDRRRWEDSETARDRERDLLAAQADAAIAVERFKAKEAATDPLERARIAAEGKYGGELIEQEAQAERVTQAVSIYQAIMGHIQKLRSENPASPELEQAISELTQAARDQANLIMGHPAREPRVDPLAALGLAIGSGRGTQPEE